MSALPTLTYSHPSALSIPQLAPDGCSEYARWHWRNRRPIGNRRQSGLLTTWRRGKAIFRRLMGEDVPVSSLIYSEGAEASPDRTVFGSCNFETGASYQINVRLRRLEPSGPKIVCATCECPACYNYTDCKHAEAARLLCESRTELFEALEEDEAMDLLAGTDTAATAGRADSRRREDFE